MNLKSLAKDTAIYGLSSIVGRFLNYLLVPMYTRVLPAGEGGYGIVTNLYAYTALFMVLLTFGMETSCFRFANKEGEKPDTVFSTSISLVSLVSLLFIVLVPLFIDPIGNLLGYPDHHDYILMMAGVVALDAIQSLLFSLLRFQKKAVKFASLKLFFIFMNIGLNLLYYKVFGYRDVFYIFMLNLVCTGLVTFFFVPELFRLKWNVDLGLAKRMFSYSWPLLVLGIAGILNQTFDKIIFPLVYPDAEEGKALLSVYGGCVKIAMIMAMITQAFRYAYEPIVFAKNKDDDKIEYYAVAMKYFVIFTLLAFLFVMAGLDLLKYVIAEDYWDGLRVVPIVMVAEIMMGIYYNLSFWYKLKDKTLWGALFSGIGCVILAAINILFIPKYGYMACAWGGVAGYGVCMLLSYFVGQREMPVPYDLRRIGFYTLLAAVLYVGMIYVPLAGIWSIVAKMALAMVYVVILCNRDFSIRPILRRLKLVR